MSRWMVIVGRWQMNIKECESLLPRRLWKYWISQNLKVMYSWLRYNLSFNAQLNTHDISILKRHMVNSTFVYEMPWL